MNRVLLANRSDVNQLEEEGRHLFKVHVLSNLGFDEETLEQLSECLPENYQDVTVQDRIKLRKLLNQYSIKIIDQGEDGLEIYVESTLVGKWHRTFWKIKYDPSEVDPDQRTFLEVHQSWWTCFEEEEDDSEEEDDQSD